MSYHIHKKAASGIKPLVAYQDGSIGSIYTTSVTSLYSDEGVTADDIPQLYDDLEEFGIDPTYADEPMDVQTEEYDYGTDYGNETADADADKKKMMMIAGGIGAVVLIAGIAVVATRK